MNIVQRSTKWDPLSDWTCLPKGIDYRKALEKQLHPWWEKIFGFYLLKLGDLSVSLNTELCAIVHQINVGMRGNHLHVQADICQLPFADKSVDACLLAHELSYTSEPHCLLREIDRVLVDDGWFILSFFHSYSVLGLGKWIPGLRKHQPYLSRMYSNKRLLDWLSLLNYEVITYKRFHVLPWSERGESFLNQYLPMLGEMGMIVARKRVSPLTPRPFKVEIKKTAINRALGVTKSYFNHLTS